MKRYLNWLWIAVASLSMASCNLFIDDDTVDENGFENVPVHTGEGYDEPVTIQEGDATITYQFKKNVRILTPEVQQWIVSTEMDPSGTGYFIFFRGDTPQNLLPVKGEILVSKPSDKFKWGLNHLVVCSDEDNGVIKFAAIISMIEDTYEELDMDGSVTHMEEETYYTVAEDIDDSIVELDENGFPINDETDGNEPSAQARQNTRASDKENIDGTKGWVEYNDDSFFINLPVDKTFDLDLPKGFKASVSTEGSTMTVDTKIDLSGFSLKDGKYNVKVTQTVDEDFKIKLTGGWSGDRRIKRFKPVKGKIISAGYVVLVLFVNIDIEVEGSVEASFFLTKSLHQTTTYDINLKDKTMQVVENKEKTGDGETKLKRPDEDEQVKLDRVIIEGKFGVFAKTHLGIGFYGKIISLRLVPKIGAELSIAMPAYWNSDSETIYDIGDETGITVTFPVTVDLGIYWEVDLDLDINFDPKEIFLKGASNPASMTFGPIAGFAMRIVASKSLDFWESLIRGNEADYDATKVHYVEEEESEGEDEVVLNEGYTHTFGPYYPIEGFHFAWFPTMKKNSFKILKAWDEQTEQLSFKGEFQCAGIGFLGGLGLHFVPALQIWNGNEMLEVIWPDEGGKNAVLREGDTYHFTIQNSSEDVVYYAKPCYYGKPLGMKQNPDALDKSLPFCAYTPMISITNMKPTYAGAVGYDSQGLYIYSFNFNLYTSVKGVSNVGSFGLEDVLTEGKYNHTYKPGGDKQLRDGTYVLGYMVKIHTSASSRQLKMNLRPWLTMPEAGSRHGSDYGFIISSEGWYRTWNAQNNEKGKKIKFTNASATSRLAPSFADTADTPLADEAADAADTPADDAADAADQVEVILRAVKTTRGEVLWQNPNVLPPTNVTPLDLKDI